GGRSAKLRPNAGAMRQTLAQRRPRHFRHQDITRADAGEFALAIDHARAPGAPADPGRVAIEAWMAQPDFFRHMLRLDMKRAGLQQLEAMLVERPFDLDRPTQQVLGLAQHAPE